MALGNVGQSLAPHEVWDLVQSDLQKVEKEISLESVAAVDSITSIGQYLHASGGKRLRPTLLLLASKLVGDGGETAIRLAAVVEIVHAATLVHDDVIDVAKTRRGRPSTNSLWGNHTSVLAGDWLYMQAFQIALRERSFEIINLLIGLTQMMVEGELLQLERIGSANVTEADYMELVDRKTASLFSSCARLGAVSARADECSEATLGEYAWNLGMAFQLTDDVLDFTAKESVLGKPVGSDLKEGKLTLPLIYALEETSTQERAQVETVLKNQCYDQVPFSAILAIVRKYRSVERAVERAETFTDKARQIIRGFPASPYQRALLKLTELVTSRDH